MRNILQGVNVSQGTVAIQLDGAAAKIEQFTFKGGDGTLTVTGGAEFGATPKAKLRAVAERFRVLGRIDRQLVMSGNAEMQLQLDLLQLDGRLVVDEGLFDTSRGDAPRLDDDVTVRRASDRARPVEQAAASRPRRNVAVTVDVDLGQNLRMRGRGLDTALRGQLRITTPGGRLAVNGTVNTEDGTYAAYGQKLDIDRGIVAFSGAVDNPRLDILALRANTDMRVGVAITGNALTPRVRLYSEDEMSDTDKLSWLMLGRAPEGLGRNDTALLQSAAVALLAGEDGSPTDGVLKNLGLDELSMRQSEDGNVRETVVTLGKQLSRRWYVGYERGVNATTGTWQLIYRIAQRFTVRAQSGEDNSLDIIWTWRIDEVPVPRLPAGVPKSNAQPP
jgi:translocation and assembly module TamB